MPWFFKKGVKRRTTPGDEENSDNSLTVSEAKYEISSASSSNNASILGELKSEGVFI